NSVIMYATSAFTLTTTNQSLSSGTRHPPATTLFPYTTLFRSDRRHRPPPGPRLPSRALRWDAPARDHRDGARAEPGARDHGRADDRARRRCAARDPAGDRGAQKGSGLCGALRHARPVAADRVRRPHRDHVRRRARRDLARADARRTGAPPVHARPAALVSAAHGPARADAGDPRLAAGPREPADR